jgi:hypothetical protein
MEARAEMVDLRGRGAAVTASFTIGLFRLEGIEDVPGRPTSSARKVQTGGRLLMNGLPT